MDRMLIYYKESESINFDSIRPRDDDYIQDLAGFSDGLLMLLNFFTKSLSF